MNGPCINEQPLETADGSDIKGERSTTSTNCHQCHKNSRGTVFQCNNCNTQYCNPCIKYGYSKNKGVLFVEACPFCLNICNCGACLQKKGPSKIQDLNIITDEEKTNLLAYIIRVLLPSLKKQDEEAETQDYKVLHLIERAEAIVGMYESTYGQQALQTCCSCLPRGVDNKNLLKASSREDGTENYLYSPMASEIEKSGPHFQTHFSNGQPVIVHGVMTGPFDLSWEQTVVERVIRSSLVKASNPLDISVINCVNWCKKKIQIREFFNGYSERGVPDYQRNPEVLKLEWHPSDMFQKQLPRHYEELTRCLPFKHYTHPICDRLSDVSMCVSYGPHRGADQWGSIIKLQYGMSDRVFTAIYLLLNHLELN